MAFWDHIKHFKKEEFKQDPDRADFFLIRELDGIREETELPIIIHEVWAESGHVEDSHHYSGIAADFHFNDPNKNYFLQLLYLITNQNIGAIGFYPNWNNPGWHIDLKKGLTWYRDKKGFYHYGVEALCRAIREKEAKAIGHKYFKL